MAKKKKYTSEQLGNNFYKAGWMPGYDINPQTGMGELTHVGTDPDYDSKYDDILREWKFDPKKYEIVGTVRASSWNTQLKGGQVETFYAFKGIVRKKTPGHDKYFQELFKQAKKKAPVKTASSIQVRKPLYRSSKNLSKNYSKFMSTMFGALRV